MGTAKRRRAVSISRRLETACSSWGRVLSLLRWRSLQKARYTIPSPELTDTPDIAPTAAQTSELYL